MSRMEIKASGILFRNPHPGHHVVNAYLPFLQELSEQEWICVYRRGAAFYSDDGVLALLRSTDGGVTWQEEGLVWDPQADEKPYSYSAPFLTQLRRGTLVLVAFRVDRSDPQQLMVHPDTGGFLPVETLLFRSEDGGHHWSAPEVLALPEDLVVHLSGPVVELSDGEWFLPFDEGKAYQDPNPVQPVMRGFFSRDQGRTWGERITFADGTAQGKGHWHGRVIRREDGRLFTLLWTQDRRTGGFVDLHSTVSDVSGRQWSIPQPTGIPGQTSWAVDLGSGRFFVVYSAREADPPGIRGILWEEGQRTVDPNREVLLWDATGRETIGMAAQDSYPVSHDVIAFGRPQAMSAKNGEVMVSFWCTEACVTGIRWCRIRTK